MPTEALDADQRANHSVNGKASYTIDQAAAQLDRAGLSWSGTPGQGTTVTYAYRASAPAQMPDDTTGFQQFSPNQISITEEALAAWSHVANITFQRVEDPGSAYSNNATILFGDYTNGEAGASAFAYLPGSRAASSVTGDVWVNSSLNENTNPSFGSYGYLTLLHEIGHAIGLSHPSDYDSTGDQNQTITFAHDASYYEDSTQYTVMSYFETEDTGSTIDATTAGPSGPLIDDIAAAQRLYGANLSASTGNDDYQVAYRTWLTIWDAGGIDTLDAYQSNNAQKLDLKPGSFSDIGGFTGNVSIALGTVIENAVGGYGNDTIIGNDAGNWLNGNDGDDTLSGGLGNDTYYGGTGSDRAVLGGNTHDYHLVNGDANGLILIGDNGSGSAWIDPSTETVQFQNGQYLSYGDIHAYVPAVPDSGNILVAPTYGTSSISGTSGRDVLYVDGNAADYTLSRQQTSGFQARQGDFILDLSSHNETVSVGETVDGVHFRDGQYLSLRDVPAYVTGNATLYYGTTGDDLLYQDVSSPFQLLAGGDGHDDAYLNGNVSDYTARYFTGDSEAVKGLTGIELIATNGSGALFIDSSTDTVHYKNGQYLSYGDIMSYEAPATGALDGSLHFVADNSISYASLSGSGAANDIALVDGNVSDYTLSRAHDGDFFLSTGGFTHQIDLAETIDTVQFANGQYLSMRDLGAYVSGSDVFTDAAYTGNVDDLLFTAPDGDQYVVGGGGVDNAYLTGNVQDYTLQQVSNVTVYTLDIFNPTYTLNGVELHANNGSGNIYIDQSTESIHFQNGQYLAYQDLGAYIHGYG